MRIRKWVMVINDVTFHYDGYSEIEIWRGSKLLYGIICTAFYEFNRQDFINKCERLYKEYF
jgi:hypothetical protein